MDTETLTKLKQAKELIYLSKSPTTLWATARHGVLSLLHEDLTVFATPARNEQEWRQRYEYEDEVGQSMVWQANEIINYLVCDNDKTCCPERWQQ